MAIAVFDVGKLTDPGDEKQNEWSGKLMKNNVEPSDFSNKPLVSEIESSSNVWRFLLFGLFLFSGVALLGFFGRDQLSAPIIISILGVFASIGVFFLFSLVLGMVQLSTRQSNDEFTYNLLSEMDTGIIVTNSKNRIVYANQSYGRLLGIDDASEIKSIETIFSKRVEASDTVYKMANSATTGQSITEEVRLDSGLRGGQEGARWFRLRVRQMNSKRYSKSLSVWQISDVTKDRQDQESAFLELQDVIHYLDHAPAGFLACENNGTLVYVNATLADWLGLDLVRFEAGSLNIRSLISPENVPLFESLNQNHDVNKTNVLDFDMLRADGKLLPVRVYQKTPGSLDGAPGTSRILVLNRSIEGGAFGTAHDAEVRFTRFFNNTPIAIAGTNQQGTIIRSNAAFQKMFDSIIELTGSKQKLSYTDLVNQEDRKNLGELFKKANTGHRKINPLDFSINGEPDRFVRFFVSQVAQIENYDELENKEPPQTYSEDDESVIIYAMEITDQRALEDQFAKSQKCRQLASWQVVLHTISIMY